MLSSNELDGKTPEFRLQRIQRDLKFRIIALQFRLFRLRVSQFALKITTFSLQIQTFSLQIRYAIVLHIHDNYPFLFWILYGGYDHDKWF